MKKTLPKNRPKNLNLLTIRLPINAVVSILHRASGVLLFLTLPCLLLAFQASVRSAESYANLVNLLDSGLIKVVLVGLSWAFSHHFFAGIRHLLQDVHWMATLQKARFSSRVVLCLAGISAFIFAVVIFR